MKIVLFLSIFLAAQAPSGHPPGPSDPGKEQAVMSQNGGIPSREGTTLPPSRTSENANRKAKPDHEPDTAPPAEKGKHGHKHGGHQPSDETDDATTRHSFGDVERWVEVFDDPERAGWQKPEEVVRALSLKKGMNVADIGAGTGYFNPYLARAVAPGGKVFASDLESKLVEHMKARAVKEKTPNVVTILAEADDPKLPDGRLDLILIVDTYHHFDDRLLYFRTLKKTFRPGGRLVIIDFLKKELPIGPAVDHKLTSDQVIAELKTAGYRLSEKHDFLPYQYFLIFDKN
jgi:ubiquinone/menaquinone biosynthesis C-methylase UbiE